MTTDDIFKITIICNQKEIDPGQRHCAGIPFSEAWWNVFKYWLGTKFSSEGLLVTSFEIEKIPKV